MNNVSGMFPLNEDEYNKCLELGYHEWRRTFDKAYVMTVWLEHKQYVFCDKCFHYELFDKEKHK